MGYRLIPIARGNPSPHLLSLGLEILLWLQQAQDVLLGCIGLRQHRSCGLVEDLQLGQLRSLKCKVGILNPTSGRRQIGRDVG